MPRATAFLALTLTAASLGAYAQSSVPTADASRRAVRCSVINNIAADRARSEQSRSANKAMAVLLMKFASSGASKEQTLSWLDEMERDWKSADTAAMQTMLMDCKAFVNEHGNTLEGLAASDATK